MFNSTGAGGSTLGRGGTLTLTGVNTFYRATTTASGTLALNSTKVNYRGDFKVDAAAAVTFDKDAALVLLHFGSALDAGAISLTPSFMTVRGDDAIPVDGGRVSLSGAGAFVFGGATSLTVSATSARAVLDLAGNALTAANLLGSASV